MLTRTNFKHVKKKATVKKWGSIVLSGCVLLGVVFCSPPKVFAASVLSPASDTRFHVIDISHWNTINWASLPVGGSDGLTAVYMKATQGTTYKDPQMSSEVTGAVSRGLQYGFYQYFEPNNDQGTVAQEAIFFYNTIKNYGYSCLPVLDVEETGNVSDDAVIVQSIHTFLDTFKNLSGLDMMIYACPSFINEHFENDTSLAKYRLWLADYGGSYFYPETPHTSGAVSFHSVAIWSRWDMWQYTSELTINGSDDGVDGNWATPSIFISTPSALSSIDSPTRNGTYSKNLTVSGWEVARNGVSRVDFYLDNYQWLGSTSNLYARDDVQKAVNQSGYYLDPSKCGFSHTFSTETLPNGSHTLYTAAIANDNSVKWDSTTFYTVDGAITDIDSPQQTACYGTITVSGWALNPSGINRVDVYAWDSNGKAHNLGSIASSALTARPDVKNAFPNYQTLNSGYSLTVNTKTLTSGTYTLAVAGIGNNGTVQWATRTITVGTAPLTTIDAPSGDQYGNFTVSGWALNYAGINRVDVYAWDSTGKAHSLGSITANALTARSDVQRAFPVYQTLNSGYSLPVDTTSLKAGTYTLAVAGIGNDGTVQWAIRTITIKPAPLTNIDTPSGVQHGNFTVSGWALNHAGINRVDVYAWDSAGNAHSLGSVAANALTARSDVQKAFPGFGTLNSGYNLTVDTSSLTAGSYTLAVAGIGNDGDVQWATRTFTYQK